MESRNTKENVDKLRLAPALASWVANKPNVCHIKRKTGPLLSVPDNLVEPKLANEPARVSQARETAEHHLMPTKREFRR